MGDANVVPATTNVEHFQMFVKTKFGEWSKSADTVLVYEGQEVTVRDVVEQFAVDQLSGLDYTADMPDSAFNEAFVKEVEQSLQDLVAAFFRTESPEVGMPEGAILLSWSEFVTDALTPTTEEDEDDDDEEELELDEDDDDDDEDDDDEPTFGTMEAQS